MTNDDNDLDLEMQAKRWFGIIGGKYPGSRFDLTSTVKLIGGNQPRRQIFCRRISHWRKFAFAANLSLASYSAVFRFLFFIVN
jgi:hypothetical protein